MRCGFTTGTAAAAAVKAALIHLVGGRRPAEVDVALLNGERLKIAVHACRSIDSAAAAASVIKDAGDDPDVTHGAEIGARVTWQSGGGPLSIVIRGGAGVGRVTKPGLEVAPGEPAINPGPRRMIRMAVEDVLAPGQLTGRLEAEIFVPQGETLAHHTLNARLGIIGGISILGTTGVVRPMSHEAYTATIRAAIKVARATGSRQVVFTTGRRSERYAQQRWPRLPVESFIQIGDYFAEAMQMAAEIGMDRVILAVFFGKAVKMAQGIAHTHARSARLTLKTLAEWAQEITGDTTLAGRIRAANTARHAFDLIKDDHPELIAKVGREVVRSARRFGGTQVAVDAVIFGFDGSVRFDAADSGRS